MSSADINLGISLSKKYDCIVVFRGTLDILGNPKYVRFLFNEKKGLLAVEPCEFKDSGCKEITTDKKGTCRIYSRALVSMVFTHFGWGNRFARTAKGSYYDEMNIVEFALEDAKTVHNARIYNLR